MSLAALTIRRNRHICERLLVPEVLEAGDHVGLEVVPSQAELLLIVHPCFGSDVSEIESCVSCNSILSGLLVALAIEGWKDVG